MLYTRLAVLSAATLLAISTAAHAAVIAAVDFGLSTSQALETDPTPNGGTWTAWNIDSSVNSNISMVVNGVTFAMPQAAGRNRNAPSDTGSFTYGSLDRDLFTSLSETTTGTTLSIAGLNPNTTYAVRIWSVDNGFNNGSVYSWYNTTGGASTLIGQITNQAPVQAASLTDNLAFSTMGELTADGTGTITLGHNDPMGNGTINAVEVSTVAVPEPATLGLLGLGAVGLLRRRR